MVFNISPIQIVFLHILCSVTCRQLPCGLGICTIVCASSFSPISFSNYPDDNTVIIIAAVIVILVVVAVIAVAVILGVCCFRRYLAVVHVISCKKLFQLLPWMVQSYVLWRVI